MTTAHRPTFDPAKGKSSQTTGSILHKRFLPSHTKLKVRGKGQGGLADRYENGEPQEVDERERLRAALLAKEESSGRVTKRKTLVLHEESSVDEEENDKGEEQGLVKRRRVLEVDPEDREDDDDGGDSGESGKEEESDDDEEEEDGEDSDEDEDDSEDEAEELRRELRKIEAERAERAKAEEEAAREREIAEGNPLLRTGSNSGTVTVRRRWYNEGVFADQARGLAVRPEDAPKYGFVNDALRSDFHRKFMDKYIR